jgi:hypothetical protein
LVTSLHVQLKHQKRSDKELSLKGEKKQMSRLYLPSSERSPIRKNGSERISNPHRTRAEKILYHYHGANTEFIRRNPEFYNYLREMALFLGNDNSIVEKVGITPEMFRVLVKLAEMAARDELDLGHRIPRGLLKLLQESLVQMKMSKENIIEIEEGNSDE